MRPKDEPIAQKGPPPIPIPRPTVSPPLIFDENYPLTRENSPPILRAVKSNVLSISISIAPKGKDGKPDHNKAMTGDDLRDFVNLKLFPYLHGFTQKASGSNTAEVRAAIGPEAYALVQEFLPGREIDVGILGNPREELTLLPLLTKDYSKAGGLFPQIASYELKWLEGFPEYDNIPLDLDPDMERMIRN